MQAFFTLRRLAAAVFAAALLGGAPLLAFAAKSGPLPPATDITVQPEYEQSVIAPETERVALAIRFKAPPLTEQAPLALALVIDRSGSMDGDKLNYAGSAAAGLVEQLDEKDTAALVTYDSMVDELFPAAAMTEDNRGQILDLISSSSLTAGGSTFLSGGLEVGFWQMEQADSPGQKRVILLSDGMANVGVTDPSSLADMAAQFRQKGVTLTTIGMGSDYDEELMQLLAQKGGGNYYYIRRPQDAERYFDRELKDAMAGVSKDITLVLNLNDNVLEARVYGYTLERRGNEYMVDISDFYGDEERTMVIEMTVKPSPKDRDRLLELGVLNLRYNSLDETGGRQDVTVPLWVEVSPNRGRQRASINVDIQALVLAARVDANYVKALDEARAGNYEQAEAIVADNRALLAHSSLTRDSELLRARQEAMELESRRLADLDGASDSARDDYIKLARVRMYQMGQGRNNALQMKEGSQGLEVEFLQEALNQAGVYDGPVDGMFSPEVGAAVRRFQSAKGLRADGVAGPQTQEKLGLY
ncbi:MAG: VWA domain-containing protein [Desulfarculales bacterium]|jgi:Ca-activated chloride channel family protein|nr:VWA domain-containing protein [Desulfarculales bacterium]